jgi:endogenous inhibitor of DNA gyrase (YacG/DUF329 family)
MTAPRMVRCPQCGQPVEWSPASRWRPFCSERCKMLDFGAWASEAYRIPAEDQSGEDGIDGLEDPRDVGRGDDADQPGKAPSRRR